MTHTRLTASPESSYCALLLAAGSGSRFRESAAGHPDSRLHYGKLLAPLPGHGHPVAQVSAAALKRVLTRVIAVVPQDAPALQEALSQAGCEIVVHADAAQGMGSSLAAGIRAIRASIEGSADLRGCLIALADMPWIKPETIRSLCRVEARHRIVAPVYRTRRGHPVRFDRTLFDDLAQLDGDTGARALMQTLPVHAMPCEDPGILQDIDTVAQLRMPSSAG